MNIGSAVRSHEFDAVHIDVASTCPAGVATLVSTAAKPHTASAIAIQTPEPRIANSSSIKSERELKRRSCAQPSLPSVMASSAARKVGRPRVGDNEQFVDQRDGEDQRAERHRRLRVDQRHADDAVRDFMEAERDPGEIDEMPRHVAATQPPQKPKAQISMITARALAEAPQAPR